MRGLWIGLALALVSGPAWGQTPQQRDLCYSDTATDDQTIDGCTAVIQSGRETTAVQAEAYQDRAYAYVNKGLNDQAIADETQSLALNPTNAFAYNNRGRAYYNKGLYDQAIADYSQSITLKPDYARAFANRGLAYENKSFRDAAIANFRAALKLDPNWQTARDGLTRLGATP
jgi:tetratricopeptide (TPR) repeat protein